MTRVCTPVAEAVRSVLEGPQWLIWTLLAYILHVECVRENISVFAPREPIGAMRQWGKKAGFGASTRSNVGVQQMFEHCEAVPTPHGGGIVARSPI